MTYPVQISELLSVSAGHRRAVQQIIDSARRGQCCALLGPRLSGTTELLQCVEAELAQDPICACIHVDLKEIEASTQRAFFASLASKTSRHIAERLGHELVVPFAEVASGVEFRGFLKDCAAQLTRDLVIIVDNLHHMPNDLIQALLTSLRAAYMDQASSGPLVVPVICGALSLAALTVGESSPFANVARVVFISGLSDSESEALIRSCTASATINVSAGAYASLLRATRGDPRLIERVCRACMRIAGGTESRRLTASTVKRVVREFIRDQAAYYEPLMEAVSLIEDDPDLLRCISLLLEYDVVPRQDLPLPLSPDLDPLALTGMVREVEENSYQVRNGVYRQFLAGHFQQGRVGYLMTLAGRWESAIEYLGASLKQGDVDTRSNLLAATVSAMYAAQDVKQATWYLTRGLAAAFGVEEARIWHAVPERKSLTLVGRLGSMAHGTLPMQWEIPITDDRLEARAYRGARSLRGQEVSGGVERAVPLLISGSEAIGVATLLDSMSDKEPTAQRERDLHLVGYLSQAARAIQEVHTRRNQLLRIAKLEQERTTQELRTAREIQVSFLPEQCPSLPGWEICADWRSAREVGGDFYDFIPLDGEHLGLVIADVSDKGMPAALFMSLSRMLVRVSAAELRSPAEALQRVNELIMTETRSDMFLTLFYGVLNWRTGLLTYANAGHNPPLLWRSPAGQIAGHGPAKQMAGHGTARQMAGHGSESQVTPLTAKGIILGVTEDIALEERQITIEPGDILVLYTDGVTEPINEKEEEFGEGRLVQVIAGNHDRPCSEIVELIHAAVSDFAGDQPQFDDYTLVGLRRKI
jgi:serine phosphatase RsbU (regulator of sigma subunit)/type II secretory pathway predicted ATPase ExeA